MWRDIDSISQELSPFNKFVIDKYLQYKESGNIIHAETIQSGFDILPSYEVYSIKPWEIVLQIIYYTHNIL